MIFYMIRSHHSYTMFDYKGIASELWNTTIDENDNDEDKYIKQLIGNVNYGLLEKGGSTSHKSIV